MIEFICSDGIMIDYDLLLVGIFVSFCIFYWLSCCWYRVYYENFIYMLNGLELNSRCIFRGKKDLWDSNAILRS